VSAAVPPVAVVGATGHTGRFVAAELAAQGSAPILIGRDAAKLAELADRHARTATRVAAMGDPASLDEALVGARAVINCAGPFFDTAFPVIDAAIRARIPYLDVTAEQATARSIYAERDGAARAAGVPLVPAMAFYGGLGDLLATAAAGDWAAPEEVRLAVALDSWHPTRGTRRTGERNTAPRLVWTGGRLAPLPDPAPRREWRFPDPFGTQPVVATPLTETIAISRHIAAHEVLAYMNLAPLADLHDPDTPEPRAVDGRGRSAQTFVMDARVRNGAHERGATASGRDIYAITAPLIVEAACRLLLGEGRGASGARAPGEIFDARGFLEALAPDQLTLGFWARKIREG
jgi:saccharopine dehydrogenase-like protein